jgi:phage FluMu protein Com
MEDIRCTQCGRLLMKNASLRYCEIKCPKCGAVNVIDRWTLDKDIKNHDNGFNKSSLTAK